MPVLKPTIIRVTDADLQVYPQPDKDHPADPKNQLTIGDMHGNAVKLVWFLIKQNFIKFNEEGYHQLREICERGEDPNKLTPQDKIKFNQLLDQMEFNANAGVDRLIGDDLADRRTCDYFTLEIIKRLRQHRVPGEILVSNHTLEFIHVIETGYELIARTLDVEHAYSMYRLQCLVDLKWVTRNEVNDLYNNYYKSFLRVLSYTRDPETGHLTIYSHAPIDKVAIIAMAVKLGYLKIKLSDIKELASNIHNEFLAVLIDKINSRFHAYVMDNKVHKLYSRNMIEHGYAGLEFDPIQSPLEFITWNRHTKNLTRSDPTITWVHGHDPSAPVEQNVINLDNPFGKLPAPVYSPEEKVYHVHFSQEQPAKTLLLGYSSQEKVEAEDDDHLRASQTLGGRDDDEEESRFTPAPREMTERVPFISQTQQEDMLQQAKKSCEDALSGLSMALTPFIIAEGGWKNELATIADNIYSQVIEAKKELDSRAIVAIEDYNLLMDLLQCTTRGIKNPKSINNYNQYKAITAKIADHPIYGKSSRWKSVLGVGLMFLSVLGLAVSMALIFSGWTAPFGLVGIKLSSVALAKGIAIASAALSPVAMIGGGYMALKSSNKGLRASSARFFKELKKQKERPYTQPARLRAGYVSIP